MNGYEDGVSIGQARARGMRWLVVGLIGWWAVSWAGLVLAQTGAQSPEDFLNDLAKLDSSYAPAGSADTGETVDLYTGSLGFVVTDVSLPGNSDLRVALQRRFSVGSPGDTDEDYAFADWQLEVPVITGVVGGDTPFHAHQSGWRYVTGTGTNAFDRCTHFGQLPNDLLVGTNSPTDRFTPTEYWGGFDLNVPGSGSQRLLGRDAGNPHAPSVAIEGHSSFPVVTKNDWVAACLPSLANSTSQPGEGFLVIAPDGRKFWFDWLVYRDMRTLDKPLGRFAFVSQDDANPPEAGGGDGSDGTHSPQSVPTANLPRLRVLLYASRVEDRFGHYVDYTYGGNGAAEDELTRIEADDGRRIDIAWVNGHIDTVTAQPQLADDSDADTHPRVWQYGYDSFNKSLTDVTLPDSSTWAYDLSDLNYGGRSLGGAICRSSSTNPDYSNSTHTGGTTLDGTVTTPAGLKVEYEVTDTARGHADTPTTCLYSAGATQQGGYYYGQPAYAETYFVWALTMRTESGPGVTSRTWDYAYSPAHGSWENECTSGCPHTTVWTTVTDPENRLTEYTWSNVFDATEGQLEKIEYHNTNSASGPGVRNQVNQYAAFNAGPWPASYGYPSVSSGVTRSNEARAGSRTPLEIRTTSEGGIDYQWNATAFDSWAEPTHVTRDSSGADGDSVSETLAYDNNKIVWVLGQFKSRTVTAPSDDAGKVPESRTYHASDATLDTISRFGHTVATYTWYPVGNAAAGQLESVKDGNNHTTSYSSYSYGVPTTISYADGHSISLTPNDFGEVLDVTDELGRTTTVERDDMGRITQKTFPTDSGHTWDPVDISYDQIASTEYGVGGTHDHWRVTRTQGRNKQVTVYDAALNPVLNYAIDSTLNAANGNVGHMTWHQYDSAGRETFASYPLDYASSLPSNPKSVITTFDVLGRVTGTEADAEAPLTTVKTFTTYTSGNQIDFENGRGYHTLTTYQAFDRPAYDKPIKVQFANGITTTKVTRDSFGAPTEMKQTGPWDGGTLSVTHSFGYDQYHRLCKQVSPETGQTAYGYDAADNLKWTAEGLNDAVPTQCTISPPSNAKISRTYDNRNRLTKIDYPSGTADKHFQYYPDGRLQYATRDAAGSNPASTWTMSWFHRGLLQSETLAIDSHSFALGYDYDSEGHRKSVTYPGIGTIQYAPDGLGRPTQAGSYATDLDYDPGGGLTQLDYGNGIQAAWGYNTRKLLDTTVYSLGSDLTNRSLTYDENGNLKTITDAVQGSSCGVSDTIFCNGFELPTYTGTGNWAFDYDDLDRLLEVTNPYVPDVFTYDPLGNIRTTSELGTFAYDATNRIQSRTGGFNFDWSDRGTLTTDGERSFTWNRANELVGDSQGGSFGYDANGWRLRNSRDGTLEYYVYNHAHQLMLRWNDTTQTETDFVYRGGKALARIEGSQVTYIQPDYHGSPLFETGANGDISRQPFYLGYGRTNDDGRSKIPGYTGAAMDVTTGHTYLGARYLYHKRFTSPDPAPLDPTSPTGMNRYAYGADDPVNNVDPLGLCVKNSDPECNPPRILPQPPQNRPEVSRSVQPMRNASDSSNEMSSTRWFGGAVTQAPASVHSPANSRHATNSQVTPSRRNNQYLKRNIAIGAGVVGTGFAVTGIVVVANVIGFPEVEIGEAVAAGGVAATPLLTSLAGEPIGALYMGAITFGSYGAVTGGVVGFLATPPELPTKKDPKLPPNQDGSR